MPLLKTLLYTVAYGDEIYLKMAENLMASAVANGYTGKTLILGEEHCFPGLPKAGLLRALSREEMESYDKILFVDSDCVFIRDVARLFVNEGFSFVVTGHKLTFFNAVFLSEEEKRSGEKRLNSGAFLMRGREAFDFLSAWERLWLDAPRREATETKELSGTLEELLDQAALQALVIRNRIRYTPLLGMRFPLYDPRPRAPDILLHFCGDARQGGHVLNKYAVWERIRATPFTPGHNQMARPLDPGRTV
jgi:hypothetical protein